MSATTPFQMLGLGASRDERGLVGVSVPWNCKTLAETMTVGGASPFGLPETGRQVSQLEDASYQVTITYEGTEGEPGEGESYEFDSSFREEPIESHPMITQIRKRYGGVSGDDGRITFPEKMPSASGEGAGLAGGEATSSEKNPLFGQTTYLVLNAVFRRTYLVDKVPKDLLDGVGTTKEKLPGGLPTPKGRNWLVMPPKVGRRGNVYEITDEWMLSKPGEKWPEAIYGMIAEMIDLRKLYVRPGDPVMPAWNRLLGWAKGFRLFAGPGVRLNRTPNGTYVVADLKAGTWDHPFKVRLSEKEATVGFGTVGGITPRIGGKSIDVPEGEEPPKLKITGTPNGDLRSWVAVEVKVGKGADKFNPEDPEAVTVKHVRELESGSALVGRHPLAMLVWDGGKSTIIRARQITHFNLNHIYAVNPQDEELLGRHLFWAV